MKVSLRVARAALAMATAFSLAACAGASDDPTAESDDELATLDRDHLDSALRRTVVARMYQQEQWMAKGHSRDYVANELAKLDPTYVSGLVRLAASTPLEPQIMADYLYVRTKLPHARFDFVLNICDYATVDPLIQKMSAINGELGAKRPDIWFFDFYDRPLNTDASSHRDCVAGPEVVSAAVTWIHGQKQLVGGNVWTSRIPDHSDLVAAPDENGFDPTMRIVDGLAHSNPGVRRLSHVENNPQKCASCGNGGRTFIDSSKQDQERYLELFARGQSQHHYVYMMPVLFPLTDPGPTEHAFDAIDLIPFEKDLWSKF